MDENLLTGKTYRHIHRELPLHRLVVDDFLKMQSQANADGIKLTIASGFRSFERQLLIWNEKTSGVRPVLNKEGHELCIDNLDAEQLLFAILRWSAIPGCSRHHWGTDIDLYDISALPHPDYKLQLHPEEYAESGPFHRLSLWLKENSKGFGFYQIYAQDTGGISPEAWHFSYIPLAKQYEDQFDLNFFKTFIENSTLPLKDEILKNIDEVFIRFIKRDPSQLEW